MMIRNKKVRHCSFKEPGRQEVDTLSDAQVRLMMVRTWEKIGNSEYLGTEVLEGRSRNRIVLRVTEELVAQHELV
jgi:hypothetical protein